MSDPGLPQRRGDLADLIRSARNGSPEALGRLFEGYRPYLLLVGHQEQVGAVPFEQPSQRFGRTVAGRPNQVRQVAAPLRQARI